MTSDKPLTKYRQSLKEKILKAAMELFVAHGIKAVKMDDIARQLSISKRTLYEIYDNKEVLLFEGIKRYSQRQHQNMVRRAAESDNVMDVILYSYKQKIEEFKLVSPQFYSEIGIYPEVMNYFEENRKATRDRFLKFLHRGVKEGYFRNDIDYQFILLTFDAINEFIFGKELYRQYSMEQIFRNILFVTLRGFCTSKGIATLDRFI